MIKVQLIQDILQLSGLRNPNKGDVAKQHYDDSSCNKNGANKKKEGQETNNTAAAIKAGWKTHK